MISHYDNSHGPCDAQLVRVAAFGTAPVTLFLDSAPIQARLGETVLTALLRQRCYLGCNDANGARRAGFCLMGACHDCWMWSESGGGFRACVTQVAEGLRLLSRSPGGLDGA